MPKKINLPLRYCVQCGKPLIRNTKSNQTRTSPKAYMKKKFCSYGCVGDWRSENLLGAKNYNFKNKTNYCIICKKIITPQSKSQKTKYCRKCYDKKRRSQITYSGVHTWLARKIGSAKKHKCKHCGKQAHDWSNIDHKYRINLNDYQPLCKKCHTKYDKKFKEHRIVS